MIGVRHFIEVGLQARHKNRRNVEKPEGFGKLISPDCFPGRSGLKLPGSRGAESLRRKSRFPGLRSNHREDDLDGIPWYSFRRSLPTDLRSLGVDVKPVQELLRRATSRIKMDVCSRGRVSSEERSQRTRLGDDVAPKRKWVRRSAPFNFFESEVASISAKLLNLS